jgi:hypothetical protein
MKNDECIIHLVMKSGKETVFQKEEGHWVEISTRGIRRPCTAEQVLSHLLPALFYGHVTTKIERIARGKPDDKS